MPKPTPYKIKRELRRIGRQIAGSPRFLTSYFLAQPYYDLVLSRHRKTVDGALPEQQRIAIYLIFPRDGLLESHIRALEWISASGYAPLLVTNQPLLGEDRKRALALSWRMIERRNYGYDFGGYRDGVLSLRYIMGDLERLVLLNDSTWFPMPGSDNWLKKVDELNADFVAAISNHCVTKVEPKDFRHMEWRYSEARRSFHYCSFAIGVGQKILKDPDFRSFWRHFRLSNNKKLTVRRGEIGLTQWVLRKGYTHAATCDLKDLDQRLNALPDDRLEAVLRNLIIPEAPRLKAQWEELCERLTQASISEWRNDAVGFILTAVAGQGAGYVLPEYMLRERGFPFLKKSPLWLDKCASDNSLSILSSYDSSIARQFKLEAISLRRERAIGFPALPADD